MNVMFISGIVTRGAMARSKTGSFWLTEELSLAAANTIFQGTIDLGAYVDVGDQQAISIEQVDFITQGYDTTDNHYNNTLPGTVTANTAVSFQLSDLNPGTNFLAADDNSLIASGTLMWDDTNFIESSAADFFPDIFGKLDESRMVVNDSLYLVSTANTTYAANHELRICARIKCRIVKLSTKDWMAIAIQSTASDN
jgi:hypothetical protein